MDTVTLVALIAALLVVAGGAATVLRLNGYGFDLRGKARRRAKDGRAGGRRVGDEVVS